MSRYQPQYTVDDMKEALQRASAMAFIEVMACVEEIKQQFPNDRRPWLQHVIDDIYDKQGGLCALTGVPLNGLYEVDHIIPFSYGGGNERLNIRLVTPEANRARGTNGVGIDELMDYLEDRWMNR